MRIIALRGDNSCGKTTTITMVYDSVLAASGTSTAKKLEGGNPHDFSDIVNYRGLKVAFLSMGDFSYATIDAINANNTLGVDVFILATNNRFVKPMRLINTFPNHMVTKTIGRPANASNNLIANTLDASTIFGLI